MENGHSGKKTVTFQPAAASPYISIEMFVERMAAGQTISHILVEHPDLTHDRIINALRSYFTLGGGTT